MLFFGCCCLVWLSAASQTNSEKWRVANGNEIETDWTIHDLTFFVDAECIYEIDANNALVTASHNEAEASGLWDGFTGSTWSSKCTGTCIIPPPLSNVQQVNVKPANDRCCEVEEAWVGIEGPPEIKCIKIHQFEFSGANTNTVLFQQEKNVPVDGAVVSDGTAAPGDTTKAWVTIHQFNWVIGGAPITLNALWSVPEEKRFWRVLQKWTIGQRFVLSGLTFFEDNMCSVELNDGMARDPGYKGVSSSHKLFSKQGDFVSSCGPCITR
jgi:hypothetical protein